MSEASKTTSPKVRAKAQPKGWSEIRAYLREHPQAIREDAELLANIGLWIKADNIVEFGPAAPPPLPAAKPRETPARRELEATARANFAAQAQTHAAVVDLLEARNHADLARRLDETARLRFGLVAGGIAIERPGGGPAGWRGLPTDGSDGLLGDSRLARMGEPRTAQALF